MLLFTSLMILHAMSTSIAFDVELQGILKLGDDFYKTLGRNNHHKMKKNSIYVRSKGKLPKKFSRSAIMRAATAGTNRTDDFIKYVDHIKNKGAMTLKETGKKIMNDIVSDNSMTQHIANITDDYLTSMQKYFEFISGKKAEFVIDEEFAFLDMVETACRLIYSNQKKILNTAIITVSYANNGSTQLSINNSLIPQIQKMHQNIFRQSITTKREEMRYVCYKFEICRNYPALTDYIADFIVEIRRLPDDKLNTFMNAMNILVQVNRDVFKTMCDEEDLKLISEQISKICGDMYSIHDALSVFRAVLTQRFKIIHSSDLKLKMKTNGVRILLDIINKAFEYERDDILSMEFDTTVKAMRSWVADERIFPESLITQLFNNIFKVLEYNLSKNAKEEMAVLIEMIMRGSSKKQEMYKSLFRDGSKYVRGEDFHSDIEII